MESEFRVWVLDDNPANLAMLTIGAASRRGYGPRWICAVVRSTPGDFFSEHFDALCRGEQGRLPTSSCWITSWGGSPAARCWTTCCRPIGERRSIRR